MQGKKHVVIHITLLVIIQWLSISEIILNALALNSGKDSKTEIIIASDSGPQEYILLIIGATSLLAVSLILCLYIQIIYRFINRDTFSTPKTVLGVEIVTSIILIVLWSSSSVIIVNHFNASSPCKFNHYIPDKISSRTCNLVNAMIIIAFITIVSWVILFFVSLITFCKLSGLCFLTLSTMESGVIHPYQNLKVEENAPVISINNKDPMITIQSPSASDKINREAAKITQTLNPDTKKPNFEQNEIANYPTPPEPAIIKNWDFDFHFEPITLDLVLPNIHIIDRDQSY